MKLRLRRSDAMPFGIAMYCACGAKWCDVFRLTREAHITDEVNITPEGHITFRASGTHRWKKHLPRQVLFSGWDGWVRTSGCRSQSPVPYHLATSQYEIYGKNIRFPNKKHCSTEKSFCQHINEKKKIKSAIAKARSLSSLLLFLGLSFFLFPLFAVIKR